MQVQYLEDLSTLVSLCKRHGFVFQSSEIYGGLNSCWDYGPLGSQFKFKVKMSWWKAMTRRQDIVGLDAAILMHPTVWKASGHVDGFSDPLVDCKKCKNRFRQDTAIVNGKVTCPSCGSTDVTEPRNFNLMFETHMGPLKDEAAIVYLRPETAQGIFVNFENVATSMRKKIPFGIAQIGKSFRNEITPGNFTFRTREFEQMEMEFFVVPGTDEQWHQYWIDTRLAWYKDLGIDPQRLRIFEHPKEKLSHYSKRTADIEYKFEFAGTEWGELEGIANRTDFDLKAHSRASGENLTWFDQEKNERWTPYVIEPAAGVDRCALTFMLDAYTEDEAPNAKGEMEKRALMKLDYRLAPVKIGVLPLSRNADLSPKAKDLADSLRKHWNVDFDDAGAIGRRYRRQDEIGTPFCITIDFESLEDQAVTIRERDSMAQSRISIDQVQNYLAAKLLGC